MLVIKLLCLWLSGATTPFCFPWRFSFELFNFATIWTLSYRIFNNFEVLKFNNSICQTAFKILHPELSFSIHSLKCSYLIPHSRNLKKAHVLCSTPRNDLQYSPYIRFIYSTICKRSRYCLWNIVRNFLHMFRII